jgi:hypothetical protein
MPAEYHYQRHAETPTTSPHLQAVITDLAAYYEVNLNKADARFVFARPEQDKHWMIANLDGQHIDVARCPVKEDDFMVPDIVLFYNIDTSLVRLHRAHLDVARLAGQILTIF